MYNAKTDLLKPLSIAAVRNKAMAMLARREYSAKELTQRLQKWLSREEAQTLVERLQAEGLQDDCRYAEAKIQSQIKKFGLLRIKNDLKQAGVSAEIIEHCMLNTALNNAHDELHRITAILEKKFPNAITDAKDRARRIRFLQSRGFTWENIKNYLETK